MGSEKNALTVFATDEQGTLAALQYAASVAKAPASRVDVLVPRVVEYGGPLYSSNGTGAVDSLAASYADLASRVGLRVGVRVCACRDPRHVSGRLMLAPSRIVVGGRWRRWIATREQELARELACDGHDVVFVDAEKGQAYHLDRAA